MNTICRLLEIAEQTGDSIREVTFDHEIIAGLDFQNVDFENVRFEHCRFSECDFTKSSFYTCSFVDCNFSNIGFRNSYWKRCSISECKGDGSNLCLAHFKAGEIIRSSFSYANFSEAVLDGLIMQDTRCPFATFQQAHLRKVQFQKVVFSGAEFFRSSLKGIDLSSCEIDGITVSETLAELKGAVISDYQASDIARMIGIKIV